MDLFSKDSKTLEPLQAQLEKMAAAKRQKELNAQNNGSGEGSQDAPGPVAASAPEPVEASAVPAPEEVVRPVAIQPENASALPAPTPVQIVRPIAINPAEFFFPTPLGVMSMEQMWGLINSMNLPPPQQIPIDSFSNLFPMTSLVPPTPTLQTPMHVSPISSSSTTSSTSPSSATNFPYSFGNVLANTHLICVVCGDQAKKQGGNIVLCRGCHHFYVINKNRRVLNFAKCCHGQKYRSPIKKCTRCRWRRLMEVGMPAE